MYLNYLQELLTVFSYSWSYFPGMYFENSGNLVLPTIPFKSFSCVEIFLNYQFFNVQFLNFIMLSKSF